MVTPAVETTQLSKIYQVDSLKGRRRVVALDSLTLTIEEGHVMGVLGPNGAGKSTAIKLLLNLIRPTGGSAKLFGLPPSEAAARQQVGYLPENPSPYEYLTGQEFVALAAELGGLRGTELRARVAEVLEQVQMARVAGLQIRRYSKGMTQRIALAQALVTRPRLLILDEPTSGLDVLGRQLIREIIHAEKKRGTSILLCSHIIPDVELLAEEVAILIGGKLVRSGAVSELLSAQGSEVEIVIEGVTSQQLATLRPKIVQDARRLIVRCEAIGARALIEAAYSANGSIVSVTPIRQTLEDAFLEAMRGSQNQVGSSIQ